MTAGGGVQGKQLVVLNLGDSTHVNVHLRAALCKGAVRGWPSR